MAKSQDIDTLELTILMPCLNEAETLETCITQARAFLDSAGIDGEVLIADNGSTDGSQELAERAGARVVHVPQKGYGAALIGGIASARGRYVSWATPTTATTSAPSVPFVEKLREGADLVMGNRFQGGIAPGAMPSLHRYLGNPVLTFVGRLFFQAPVGDFHCGLRAFRRDSIIEPRPAHHRHGVRQRDGRQGLRCAELDVAEVPTTLRPDGRSRPPHLRSWRDGWRHLRFLLLYSPRWLFLYPGLLFMVLGLVSTIALVVGPVTVGSVGFDVGTLLFTLAATIVRLPGRAVRPAQPRLRGAGRLLAAGPLPQVPRLARPGEEHRRRRRHPPGRRGAVVRVPVAVA